MRWRNAFCILVFIAAVFSSLGSEAEAQRRHGGQPPRSPVFRGTHGYTVRPAFRVYGGYYSPYFSFYYDPWFGPWYPPYYAPYGLADYARSGVRIEVKPVETEVFVDGYYAGVVDDFDGFFQRLYLSPGEHEIELYLEGYRSIRESLFLSPDSSYRIRHEMEPLAPGEAGEPRPVPEEAEAPKEPEALPQETSPRVMPREVPGATRPSPFGMLALRIQPTGSEVRIDGELWTSDSGPDPLVIHLSAGPHRVEIRKEGYQRFATELEVRVEETSRLNVRLPPLGPQVDLK